MFNSDTSEFNISISVLSGSLELLIGKEEGFKDEQAVKKYTVD